MYLLPRVFAAKLGRSRSVGQSVSQQSALLPAGHFCAWDDVIFTAIDRLKKEKEKRNREEKGERKQRGSAS